MVKAITFDLDNVSHPSIINILAEDELCYQFDVWSIYQHDTRQERASRVFERSFIGVMVN